MTRDHHTNTASPCKRLRAVLCDRRVLALLLTLAVVAVLSTGLAVAQEDDDEIVYISQTDGETGISAWDNETGSFDWVYDPGGDRLYEDIELSPGGSNLYGAERGEVEGNITAVSASTGSELWHTTLPSNNLGGIYPGPSGDVVVAVGLDGIYVVDASDGSEIWSETGDSVFQDVVVTSDGESLIVAGNDGVYKHDLMSGDRQWSNEESGQIMESITIDHETDRVYVGGQDDAIRELDVNNGSETDSVSVSGRVRGLDYRDGAVYSSMSTGATSGSVSRVNTDPSLSVEWTHGLSNVGYDPSVSPDGGSVYSGDGDGMLTKLNAMTGDERWQQSFGGSVFSVTTTSPFAGADVDPGPELDPQLEIDAPIWMEPGTSQNYTVTHYPEYTNESQGPAVDVTGNASLTSDNTTVLSVDTDAESLTASEDEYARVTLNASHDGLETTHNVTVSPMTAEYLEIIPGPYRFTATFNETGFQIILIAIMSGVVATRLSTAFGGIGAAQLVLLIGWFAGFVSLGIALVGLFTAMFIGFNLAANVDYSVRR